MLTVEHYARIRTAKRDGMSIRAISRIYRHSHHTVTKALNNPKPRHLSALTHSRFRILSTRL